MSAKTKNRILNNNFYMLRLVFRLSPGRVFAAFFMSISNYGSWAFFSVVFMRYIFDSIETGRGFDQILFFILVVAAVYLVIQLIEAWLNHRYIPTANRVLHYKMNRLLFEKATGVDISCYENPDFYNNYTMALNQASQKSIAVVENLASIIAAVLAAVFVGFTIVGLDPIILAFLALPLISFVLSTAANKTKYKQQVDDLPHTRKKDYTARSFLLKKNAKEIKLSNISNVLESVYDKGVDGINQNTKKYGKKIFTLRFFADNLSFTLYFNAAWLYIAYRVMVASTLTMADYVVLASAVVTVSNTLRQAIFSFMTTYENSLYISKVRSFMSYEAKIPELQGGVSPDKIINTIEFKNVSFTYEGQTEPVLKNISFKVGAGQIIAFVGHNGAGKSTIVKLIMRLYDVTDGEILLNGINIKQYNVKEYRKLFGTAFQDFQLFAMSVAENVNMNEVTAENEREDCRRALEESGALDKINSLEKGMDTLVTKEFDNSGAVFSGGEAQKIAVARVYAKNRPLVILDEPSSALDPVAEYEMYESLSKIYRRKQNKTVFLISHRLSFSVLADKIYLFENGEITEEGTHSELMSLNKQYADLFTKQAKNYLSAADNA